MEKRKPPKVTDDLDLDQYIRDMHEWEGWHLPEGYVTDDNEQEPKDEREN